MSATLYLETYGLALRKSGGALRICREGKRVKELPAIGVEAVVVAAEGVSISGGAVRLCGERNIPLFFLPRNGGAATVLAPVESSKPDRLAAQIAAHADPARVLAVGRGMVRGKVKNQLALMRYFAKAPARRSGGFNDAHAEHAAAVTEVLARLAEEPPVEDLSLLRGRLFSAEGRAASLYWRTVAELIPLGAGFAGRRRKGAEDPVNSMLNYGYAILCTRIHHAVIRSGLSTYFSFLHSPQPGRASLVYDLVEEFRPWAVDRVVIGMLGKGRKPTTDDDGRLMPDDRRCLIERLEARWKTDDLPRRIDGRVGALVRTIETGEAYRPLLFQANGRIDD